MISLRLPTDLEEKVSRHSDATGVPRNLIITQAVRDHLDLRALDAPHIEKAVAQNLATLERQERERDLDREKRASQIGFWIEKRTIWTKDPALTSGEPVPAIHGRNVIVGYADLDDGSMAIIAQHLDGAAYGYHRYHRYVISYEDWIDNMVVVEYA